MVENPLARLLLLEVEMAVAGVEHLDTRAYAEYFVTAASARIAEKAAGNGGGDGWIGRHSQIISKASASEMTKWETAVRVGVEICGDAFIPAFQKEVTHLMGQVPASELSSAVNL